MNEKSADEQATANDQPAAEAQDPLTDVTSYSGGSTLLDAQIEASQLPNNDPALEQPIATDIAGNTDNPSDAQSFTTTGDSPIDQEGLEQKYSAPPNVSE